MNNPIYFIIFLTIISCSKAKKEDHQTSDNLRVVATTGMLYDAVLNISGSHVTLDYIMGPGVDPHLYKATQGDLSKFNEADFIVYNGLMLEGKMGEILKKLGRQKTVLAAAECIPPSQRLSHPTYENAFDPHVWFDVSNWKMVIKTIRDTLMKVDTAHAADYQKNAEHYLLHLDSLDTYVRNRIQEIPESNRILITAHDAFGYFGKAYGIEVQGLQGISTVADFGLKDIAEIIDLIVENNISAIFVETSVSDKSINAVIEGCKEKGIEVKIGGSLYSDAMGDFGTPEGTYIGMFKKNVDTIVEALK